MDILKNSELCFRMLLYLTSIFTVNYDVVSSSCMSIWFEVSRKYALVQYFEQKMTVTEQYILNIIKFLIKAV